MSGTALDIAAIEHSLRDAALATERLAPAHKDGSEVAIKVAASEVEKHASRVCVMASILQRRMSDRLNRHACV